jgi:hypothetical protein
MMQKDESVNELLRILPLRANGWVVVDHWDADLCAVGIAHESCRRRLVYISTYGKQKGIYDFECEIPAGPEASDYSTVERGENVNIETLLDVIRRHLAQTPR